MEHVFWSNHSCSWDRGTHILLKIGEGYVSPRHSQSQTSLLDMCRTSRAPCAAFPMLPSGTCALLLHGFSCSVHGWSIVPPDFQFRCSVSRERGSNGKESGGGSGWTHPLCYSAKPEGWNLIHHSRHGSHWTKMTFGSVVGLPSHLGLPQCSPVVKSWRSLFLPCGRCRLSEGLVVRQQRGTTWKESEADPLSLWWPRWPRV